MTSTSQGQSGVPICAVPESWATALRRAAFASETVGTPYWSRRYISSVTSYRTRPTPCATPPASAGAGPTIKASRRNSSDAVVHIVVLRQLNAFIALSPRPRCLLIICRILDWRNCNAEANRRRKATRGFYERFGLNFRIVDGLCGPLLTTSTCNGTWTKNFQVSHRPGRAIKNPETIPVRASAGRDYSSPSVTAALGFAGSFTTKFEPRPTSLVTSIVPP